MRVRSVVPVGQNRMSRESQAADQVKQRRRQRKTGPSRSPIPVIRHNLGGEAPCGRPLAVPGTPDDLGQVLVGQPGEAPGQGPKGVEPFFTDAQAVVPYPRVSDQRRVDIELRAATTMTLMVILKARWICSSNVARQSSLIDGCGIHAAGISLM